MEPVVLIHFKSPLLYPKHCSGNGGETSVRMTIGETKVAESMASIFTAFLNVLAVKEKSQSAWSVRMLPMIMDR